MRTALRQHLGQDKEEGFTLIELMVVVLIIGILLAIAIPTFLGARDRANDKAAQANLRNAMTSEKTLFTDNQSYVDSAAANLATLQGVEPNLNWVTGAPAGSKDIQVKVANGNGTADLVTVIAKSQTGTCFYMSEEALPGSGAAPVAPGTYFAQNASATCTPPANWGNTAPANPHASSPVGTWSVAW